jgi:hypothetical protein
MTTDTFNVDGVNPNDDTTTVNELDLDDNLEVNEVPEKPVVVEEQTILSPKPEEEAPSLVPVSDGVIGAGTVKKSAPKPKKVAENKSGPGTVALFAARNISWNGVGKLVKGYNLVSSTEADKWLTLDAVRLVDPEEVRTNLG